MDGIRCLQVKKKSRETFSMNIELVNPSCKQTDSSKNNNVEKIKEKIPYRNTSIRSRDKARACVHFRYSVDLIVLLMDEQRREQYVV